MSNIIEQSASQTPVPYHVVLISKSNQIQEEATAGLLRKTIENLEINPPLFIDTRA